MSNDGIEVNTSVNNHSMNAHLSRLVTSDELLFDQKQKRTERENEDTGCLPPQGEIVFGGSDTDGPVVETQRECSGQVDFLYDSEVGTKYRGTTYYKPKRWSQKEDLHLLNLVSKYKSNWKKISVKILPFRDQNVETKSEIDCCRRWTTIKRKQKQEWTDEADDLLLKLVTTKGHNWKLFEKYFNG